jgi:hypothetical protein
MTGSREFVAPLLENNMRGTAHTFLFIRKIELVILKRNKLYIATKL